MTLLELLRQELPKRGGCPACQSVQLRFCMMRGIGRVKPNWPVTGPVFPLSHRVTVHL